MPECPVSSFSASQSAQKERGEECSLYTRESEVVLSVACIDIKIRVADGCRCEENAAEYRNFVQATTGFRTQNRLRVTATLVPDDASLDLSEETEVILDPESSWSIFRINGGYCLCSARADDGRPYWMAEVPPAFNQMTVYCGPDLVNNKIFSNPLRYPLDQIFLMLLLSRNQGAIFHTAGFRLLDSGFLCAGVSRAGKTTISRLIHEHTDAEILSDDRMIVRKIGDAFIAFGTPWPGEGGFAVNDGVPLHALLFLRKADHNKILPLSPAQALDRLLPVASVPWFDADLTGEALDFCDDLLTHVPAYEFSFTPDADACRELERLTKKIRQN